MLRDSRYPEAVTFGNHLLAILKASRKVVRRNLLTTLKASEDHTGHLAVHAPATLAANRCKVHDLAFRSFAADR
jgi:hypothetical protein